MMLINNKSIFQISFFINQRFLELSLLLFAFNLPFLLSLETFRFLDDILYRLLDFLSELLKASSLSCSVNGSSFN